MLKNERDAAYLMALEAEARIESKVKAIEARMEDELEDLMVLYNANILGNHNLNWIEDYPFHLYKAWSCLVEDEKWPATHQLLMNLNWKIRY